MSIKSETQTSTIKYTDISDDPIAEKFILDTYKLTHDRDILQGLVYSNNLEYQLAKVDLHRKLRKTIVLTDCDITFATADKIATKLLESGLVKVGDL